jgi:pyridoxal phosphate enzyme (YggS family)
VKEMTIVEAVRQVQENIAAAQSRCAIDAGPVLLLAVTKTKPVELLAKAIEAGITDFGENRVQELISKYDSFPDANWHLIGHLQTNKVRQIIGKTVLIHSLDRLSLAQEIEKRSAQADLITNALVQINIAEEDTKSGIHQEELADFLSALADFPHIRVQGLMTIGPHVFDKEEIRPVFRCLRELFDEYKSKGWQHLDFRFVSMGMSYDYDIAVEEGANIIRVGSSIFGSRA